jgi:hypothetical protein
MDRETLKARALADRRAGARKDATHESLVDGIWEAADEGMRQVDIVDTTGLTRERVRQICAPEYRERALERREGR